MYKNNRLQEKYLKLQRSKKTSQESEDTAPITVTNVQLKKENNDAAQNNYDRRLPGHSTPVRKKDYTNNVEDSPETDYHCSPIPCTQDGGNDVAWDWQNTKPPHDKSKMQSGVETPKRTKQLQKKRNSNSPLLYKPVKRKLAKVERMESIGKFTAELKALTEKMNDIHKNDDSHSENELLDADDVETNIIVELDQENNEINIQDISDKERNSESSSVCKINSSYADLFDDAADDSMVRCSQEIEARLLDRVEKSHSIETSVKSEGKEPSASSENTSTKGVLSESSKNTSGRASRNSCPKAFVKSVDQTADSMISVTKQTDLKTSIKTNVLPQMKTSLDGIEKTTQTIKNNISNDNCKQILSVNMSESFEFPDDSFDDCLATCVDDEKLLSKLNEYDNVFPDEDQIKNPYGDSYKNINLKSSNTKMGNTFVPKISVAPSTSKDSESQTPKVNHKNSNSNHLYVGRVENGNVPSKHNDTKKFLKAKSLSESNFEYNDNTTLYKNNSASLSQESKSVKRNLEEKNTARTHLFVTTNLSSKEKKSVSDDNIAAPSNRAGACERLSANRFMQKEGGKFIVRHNSDTSFNNIAKETCTASQPQQCTPEEIEKKRLEAKMRLEAKRRLLLKSNGNCVGKVAPVMRPVQR